MPHKFNAHRCDKVPMQMYRVTNGAEYNEALRRGGDLTVHWLAGDCLQSPEGGISQDAICLWTAVRRTTRGEQRKYLDLTIELCLTLGVVFTRPLRPLPGRQLRSKCREGAQRLMRLIARLIGVNVAVQDFSTLSRRRDKPRLLKTLAGDSDGPAHLPGIVRACRYSAQVNGLRKDMKSSVNGDPGAS